MGSPTLTSLFLLLPSELRLEIYHHFHRLSKPTYPRFHKPYLPLLLTCRTVHSELAPLLPPWINYSFPNPAALIDYFSTLGEEWWTRIKYVTLSGKVSGNGMGMRVWMKVFGGGRGFEGEEGEGIDQGSTCFGPSSVIKLWRGLRLEKLVIEFDEAGKWYGREGEVEWARGQNENRRWEEGWMFGEVEAFVASGKGWREVELKIPSVACVTVSAGSVLGRQGKRLKERDEGGTVETMIFDHGGETLKVEEAWEFEDGMMVYGGDTVTTIRRGRGIDHAQDCETEDWVDQQLLDIFRSRSWKQIREQGLLVEQESG